MKHFPRFVVALTLSALTFPLASITTAGAVTQSPSCIVSLSPTATASLYEIGAGSQVGAVDQDSTYPAAAAVLATKSKINPLSPSAEGIATICAGNTKPSLVVISYNANNIEQKLTALGVKVVTQLAPTSLSGALAQIKQLGSLTGHVSQASKLTASMTKAINADVASIAKHPTKKLTVFYEIGTKPYYSLTSATFIGSILKSLGLVNIADAVATSADAGYPSLTPEYVLSSNPKMIITADAQSASDVSARSGFENLSAVKAKTIVVLNPNLASEWGPQLPQLVHAITTAVKAALANNTLWK